MPVLRAPFADQIGEEAELKLAVYEKQRLPQHRRALGGEYRRQRRQVQVAEKRHRPVKQAGHSVRLKGVQLQILPPHAMESKGLCTFRWQVEVGVDFNRKWALKGSTAWVRWGEVGEVFGGYFVAQGQDRVYVQGLSAFRPTFTDDTGQKGIPVFVTEPAPRMKGNPALGLQFPDEKTYEGGRKAKGRGDGLGSDAACDADLEVLSVGRGRRLIDDH
ncbi:hypothetical protein C8R43DRAFT_1148228 [Mycena crocata]|nr:hypothetical protein C8R43DRAFT_1148228 [Mycena crocata]